MPPGCECNIYGDPDLDEHLVWSSKAPIMTMCIQEENLCGPHYL